MEVSAQKEGQKEHPEGNMSSSSCSEDEERARARRRHRRKRGQGYPSAFSAVPYPFMELPGSGMPTCWPGGGNFPAPSHGFPPHAVAPFFPPPQPSAEFAQNPGSSTLLQPCAASQDHSWPAPHAAAPLLPGPSFPAPGPLAPAPCMPPPMPLPGPLSSTAPAHPQEYMRPHPHCCHSGPPPAYPQACTHTHPSAAPAAGQQQLGYGAAAAAPRCPSSWADPSHHAAPPAWNAPLPYPQHSHAVHAHAQPPTVEGQHAGQAAWQHPGAPPTQQQLGLSTAPQAAAAAAASRGGRQVAALQGELRVRKAQLMQQLARLSSHCAEVQAAAADQEQQASRLAQDLQDRVHSVEAMQLAALDKDKAQVAQEVSELDVLLERMAAALASDSAAGPCLLLQAPVLLEEAMHTLAKPLPEQKHLPPPMDIVRSYAQLSEAHSALERLLEVKDHMISHLLQERDTLKEKLKEQAEDNAQMLRQHCARLSSELGDVKRERPGPSASSAANPTSFRRSQAATDRSVVHDLISELAEKSKQLLARAPGEGQVP